MAAGFEIKNEYNIGPKFRGFAANMSDRLDLCVCGSLIYLIEFVIATKLLHIVLHQSVTNSLSYTDWNFFFYCNSLVAKCVVIS